MSLKPPKKGDIKKKWLKKRIDRKIRIQPLNLSILSQ